VDVEQLSIQEGREEGILAFLAVILLYLQKDMLVHVIFVNVPIGGEEGLDGAYIGLIRQ